MNQTSSHIPFDQVEWYHGEGDWQEKVVVAPELGAGKLSTAYVIFQPGGSTHDYHVHDDLDEALIVVDGVLDAFGQSPDGEVKVQLQKGDTYFTPRGVPHRFANPYSDAAIAVAVKAIL